MPWRNLSDAEFEEAARRYRVLRRRRWFVRLSRDEEDTRVEAD